MNEQEQKRITAIACLKEIAKILPGGTNLDAFLADQENTAEFDLILSITEKLKLSPEVNKECTMNELATYFGAPVFLELKNGNFVQIVF